MPCEGIERLNPICLPVNAAEATATANQFTDPFSTIAGFFSSAANNATTWLWAQINDATTLDLQSPQLLREMTMTGAIAAVLCVGLFLIQLIAASLRGHPPMLGRAFSGLLISFFGSAFAIATTRLLLGAVDALSNGVIQFTLGTSLDGLGAKFAFANLAGLTNPAIVILVSLVVLASVVVVWAAMMIRKLMILLAAVLAPLAFAGATADFTRGWVRKWIEFTAAMIASKLLLVIILSLGISILNGAGQSGTGDGQTATQLIGGSLILLLGGLAPWAAIRMFHFAGDSLYAAHSVARQSGAGAQSVISGPQKVAALQGQARALSAGFGPRGGSGGGRGGGATTPPSPQRPAFAGWPAPAGLPAGAGAGTGAGGGAGVSKPAGAAAASGGAAAATSAAVPVIGAAAATASGLKGAVNTVSSAAQSAAGGDAATGGTNAPTAPGGGYAADTATTSTGRSSGPPASVMRPASSVPPKQPPTSSGGSQS
ncbi:hypothetical protein [Humibacillus xanthopallidus]|uniref:TrbL/VirB6 plasmid conjugal transfer protein n=1 Tax=Humibacillus xanthopallidus TaxID=412689 RepID=A0A543HTX0_9MICO|nr:hypothetical protein [Humibacillus xanthopallidus]TQM61730.1 hypothetical protein FBY41_1743 [Humibacillus xanthopallidus]